MSSLEDFYEAPAPTLLEISRDMAMTVLGNYVVLQPEEEKVLRFQPGSWRVIEAAIRDPATNEVTVKRRWEADVTEEDGQTVAKTFSTLSSKLATQLAQMHEDGELYRFKIGIISHPLGYRTEYTLHVF